MKLSSFVVGNKISSPIVLEHFVVMDDYSKQAKSDINLKKGRTVEVIEKRECGKCIIIKFRTQSGPSVARHHRILRGYLETHDILTGFNDYNFLRVLSLSRLRVLHDTTQKPLK